MSRRRGSGRQSTGRAKLVGQRLARVALRQRSETRVDSRGVSQIDRKRSLVADNDDEEKCILSRTVPHRYLHPRCDSHSSECVGFFLGEFESHLPEMRRSMVPYHWPALAYINQIY